MRADPFFSIVIPTYNRAAFLERQLPGLTNLNYENYEVIIVDDGSTDATSSVVAPFVGNRIKYYRKENAERAAARNFGAKRSNGDYVTFLDSDDVIFPNALLNAATALREKGYPSLLHLSYEIGTSSEAKKTINNIRDQDPTVLVVGNPLSCMGVFVRSEVFAKHTFNEDRDLSGSEDWEFWMRLVAHYGLRTDKRLFGRLIQHEGRSVIHFSEDQLVKRKRLALQYAFSDPAVEAVYGRFRKTIEAHWETYIALHLAIAGKRKAAMKYFIRAGKCDVGSLFNKRGLVILKLILLG